MIAHRLAKTAYAATRAPLRTPRGTEYDAFARITAQLNTARAPGTPFAALVAAVHENRRLWTVLAADLVAPENGLPASLRARLLFLAKFTHAHSAAVLAGRENADALVEINTAIMRGLAEREGAA